MDFSTLLIWGLALVMGSIAYLRRGQCYRQGLNIAKVQILTTVPKLAVAIIAAGFFAQIVPTEIVANWLGREAGLKGILLGSLLGGLTPGGPLICFPIIYVFLKAGASIPALMSFVTAWSVFAVHRVVAFELPLLGARFVKIRFLSCLLLPPLAGLAAAFIVKVFHIEI